MTNYIAALVDELYQLGVREVVISPGSRSTPLAMLFCEHQFETFLNIDERSASFFALGIAKEKIRPVVLVCTSGSAVANYFPAIVEAKHSGVPLIVLTADRPHELRNVGAPQTIDQNNIFGNFVKYYEELALPEENEAMYRYVRAVMDKGYANALARECGVVHINVPVREPLVPDFEKLDFTVGRTQHSFEYIRAEHQLVFDGSIFSNKKGIIICGADAYSDYQEEVLQLAERLKAPVLADPLSNIRNYSNELIIDSYDAFLKSDEIKQQLAPDYIIQFGQVPVSKRLQQFISLHEGTLYIQVWEGQQYGNPSLTTKTFVSASPKAFMRSIAMENNSRDYLNQWLDYQEQMREQLNGAKKETELFEGRIIQELQQILPEKSRLMVANSMAIRDMDYFFEACNQNIKVLCNRGANGIDGTVSTALGISTCQEPTVLVTGDLAFYHDLNGLLIGNTHDLNLTIVLLNNSGGGIFNYLPQRQAKHFEYLFLTPHRINFEGAATLYGVNYEEATDYQSFEECVTRALTLNGVKIIEVKIDSQLSKNLHDKYSIL